MIEAIIGFVLSGLFINSVAYVIGSIILGIVTSYLAKAKPRDSVVALTFFTILSIYQFFFRFFEALSPERLLGQYIYIVIFLGSTYVTSRLFYERFEAQEIEEVLKK